MGEWKATQMCGNIEATTPSMQQQDVFTSAKGIFFLGFADTWSARHTLPEKCSFRKPLAIWVCLNTWIYGYRHRRRKHEQTHWPTGLESSRRPTLCLILESNVDHKILLVLKNSSLLDPSMDQGNVAVERGESCHGQV